MSTVSPTRGVSSGVGAVLGTATNDNAATGYVGELVSAAVAAGSAVSLTTADTANITSISLTAGDWDVTGIVQYTPGATTSITQLTQGSSSTSATLGAQGTFTKFVTAANILTAVDPSWALPPQRFSLSATTTIFLVANAVFSVSTLTGYGVIRARRVR